MRVAANSDRDQGKLDRGDGARVVPASANHLSGMSRRKLCTRKAFDEVTSKSLSKYKILCILGQRILQLAETFREECLIYALDNVE